MDLINRLNIAIDIEYDSMNEEQEKLKKLPIEERVLKGDSILINKIVLVDPMEKPIGSEQTPFGLAILSDPNYFWFLEVKAYCSHNISKLRKGTPVFLKNDKYCFDLVVSEENEKELILKPDRHFREIEKNYETLNGWYLDIYSIDLRNVLKKATSYLTYNDDKRELLKGIFWGKIRPSYSKEKIDFAKAILKDTELNDKQKEAFLSGYSSENYCLIQGPPGTGKTWLLAHLAIQFAKEGKKILITALTHTAINNALDKCLKLTKEVPIFKVGKEHHFEGLNLNRPNIQAGEYHDYSYFIDQGMGIIVGATCYAPFTQKLESEEWDIVIIDEAGQVSIPLAVAAMAKGEKYIFIGDHKQLPPILSNKHQDKVFTKSIFEHLFQFDKGVMLEKTYRMNNSICNFPSKEFYEGRLIPDERNADWILEINNEFKNRNILDITKPEILVLHNVSSTDTRSEFEADLITKLVFEYIEKGIKPKDIAIITPLRAQVRQIKNSLSQNPGYSRVKRHLFIDTVERIQGQERDVVFYSLAISDPIKLMQRPEFYFNPNRLNVALTRAKKKRIVIANKALFEQRFEDEKIQIYFKVFTDFFEQSNAVEIKNTPNFL